MEMNYAQLLDTLKKRFEKTMNLHEGISWQEVQAALVGSEAKLQALSWMEETKGEPNVVRLNDGLFFVDCSKETPTGRRGCCFDELARTTRKKFPPEESVESLLKPFQAELLSESDYRSLQQQIEIDLKTSSWIKTDDAIRQLGGALFCDRRYNTVFVYHNGADSYYSSRAFRVKVTI